MTVSPFGPPMSFEFLFATWCVWTPVWGHHTKPPVFDEASNWSWTSIMVRVVQWMAGMRGDVKLVTQGAMGIFRSSAAT